MAYPWRPFDFQDVLSVLSLILIFCLGNAISLSLICSFDETKNRRKFYRRKDCIKNFCWDLKELATEISNHKEKEMATLTDKDIKFYEKQKVCHICREIFVRMKIMKKNLNIIIKSEIIVTKQEYLEELLIVLAI